MRHDNFELFKLEQINQLSFCDCIEGMSRFPNASFDLAIIDPPYNLSKGNIWKWDSSKQLPGFGGDWEKVMKDWDNMSLRDYLSFTIQWLTEIKRLVKPSGSFWIHGTYHNIGIINVAMQMLGLEIINEVVWFKRNSFPNLSGRRLTASHEIILWGHTGGPKKRKYLFNYDDVKQSDFPEDSFKMNGKQMRTVWDIPNNKQKDELLFGKHPTQKPLRLLTRMLQVSGAPGQICLVPFAGSGSECVAAVRFGIHYVAFENDLEYFEIAKARLAKEENLYTSGIMVSETKNQYKVLKTDSAKGSKIITVPSIIKWTGSKRSQARRIASFFPEFNRYFEPFLGGGALLYLISTDYAFASDIYKPLIDFWRILKQEPEKLIQSYTKEWKLLQKDLPGHFYKVRERFNKNPNPFDLSFLARTCVNGIIRFNQNGEFNNSFHLTRQGMLPNTFSDIVSKWHNKIRNVTFRCCDYEELLMETKSNDFVYLDPPYFNSQNRYIMNLDQERLFSVLNRLSENNVKWALSLDGSRGDLKYLSKVPSNLYKRHIMLAAGHSTVKNVLARDVQRVKESLYLNY